MRRTFAPLLASAVMAAAAWRAWLGFHADYDLDPATGHSSGPYTPAQVTGLVITLVVAVFVAAWLARPVPAVAGGVLGLGLAAAADWGTQPDQDGLWVIGVTMIVLGATAAGTLIGLLAWWVRRPSAPALSRG